MSQRRFKKNAAYLCIIAGSLITPKSLLLAEPSETISMQDSAIEEESLTKKIDPEEAERSKALEEEAQKKAALVKSLTTVHELLDTSKIVIDKTCLVLEGSQQAFREIPLINIDHIIKSYHSAGYQHVDQFVQITATVLKRVVEFFKAYQNNGNAIDFAQKGEQIITFDKVIEIMQAYRNVLLDAAQKAGDTALETKVLNICGYISTKKIEWDAKTKNPIFAVSNIEKAMGNSKKTSSSNRKR